MDVTSVGGLLAGGTRHGPAIAPGHPERSVLLRAIRGELAPRMPLDRPPLSPPQVETISNWIRDYRPVLERSNAKPWDPFRRWDRPTPPEVGREYWVRNGIDRFILARLESAGLEPAPQANRRTLARGLYFDLIGEPPPPEEVEAFLADEGPAAYDGLIDRLLSDPRYGERWGRHWLDVAR